MHCDKMAASPAHADHLKLIINLLKVFSYNLNTMYNNEHQILSRVYCDFSQSVSSNVYIIDGQSELLSRQSYIFTQLFCIYFNLTRVILCIDITLFSWYSISFICTQTLKQICNQTRYNAVWQTRCTLVDTFEVLITQHSVWL